MIRKIRQNYDRIRLIGALRWFTGAALFFVISVISHEASAQHPFAHRIGVGALFGQSLLPGKMHTYFQGDFSGVLRVKYNYSSKLALDANIILQKKYLNKIDIPAIPALKVLGTPEDVMMTAKFTPIILNVTYYLSKWDTKPYVTAGIGIYNLSTEVYANFPANTPPEILLSANEKKFGFNVGVGMETFIRKSVSLEIKFSYHIISYSAPTSGGTFQFPVDNPQIFTVFFGGNYYFR